MIDSFFRSPYQRWVISPLLKWKKIGKVSPLLLTTCAALLGILVPIFLLCSGPYLALIALLLSGFCDTLDGSLARFSNRTSDFGAILDILSDRLVEFSTIFGLYLLAPTVRGIAVIVMLGAMLLCITSFLIVGIFHQNTSNKSFHYSPGIIERAEAFLFFSSMILFPTLFLPIAYLFTFLVFFTTIMRIFQFTKVELSLDIKQARK